MASRRGGLDDLGLRDQSLLLLDAFLHGLLVGEIAVLDEPVGLGLGASGARLVLALGSGGEASGLFAGLPDHPFAVLTGLGDHPVGLRLGVGQQPVGLGAGSG